MSHARRIVVIGGGIVGLATVYKLLQVRSDLEVTLLEKESHVGRHQTGNNSGVLHAGLYYKPGSSKALLAVAGVREMVEFCRRNEIAHEVCGKLVVAVDEAEKPALLSLFERGRQNGLTGLRLLTPPEIREIEPHAAGVAALHVPEEGIVDYSQVARKLAELIAASGGRVITGAQVRVLRAAASSWVVQTTRGDFEADYLITCAGLHADRIMKLAGEPCPILIVPFRGEYYELRPERRGLVRNLIYPVPDPRFPFLGVHFTRRIHGGIEAGPNAVLAFAREGYTRWQINLGDLAETAFFPGVWRFLYRYSRPAWDELTRSLSKESFAASLRRLVPEVQASDLAPGGAGVRAQAMRRDGSLVEDFEIVERRRALFVLNSPSPAATASLSIGEALASRAIAALEN